MTLGNNNRTYFNRLVLRKASYRINVVKQTGNT